MSRDSSNNNHPYFITTAIPYVNAAPHVGFALELVQADVLARWHRQRGRDVRFLSGTDDNSLKNLRAAQDVGIAVQSLVQRNGDRFEDLQQWLDLSLDDFIRTSSDERHVPAVHRLWRACQDGGDLYRSQYTGCYCVGCESYLRAADLDNGRCPEHGTPPEPVAEDNYFFRLSRYSEQLRSLIRDGTLVIEPERYRNEVLRFLDRGLEDISVSRSSLRSPGWGIPVPDDPDQVIYVWFDALTNYISALGYGSDGPRFDHYWTGNGARTHLIGKGITRFHAIYWPAILLSAGLPLPSRILVHGYLTVDGRKIGKSLGNAIAPEELVERYGTDAVRHYLVHHFRCTHDGDFSEQRLVAAHDHELADKLGNLVQRVTSLVHRYAAGTIPQPGPAEERERELIEVASPLETQTREALARFALHDATAAIWAFVDAVNGYLVATEPWHLAKRDSLRDRARLGTVLYTALEAIRVIAAQLSPFLPRTCAEILGRLGVLEDSTAATQAAWGQLRPGTRISAGSALFPKIDDAHRRSASTR